MSTFFRTRHNNAAILGFKLNPPHVYTVFSTHAGGFEVNIKNPAGFIFNLNRINFLPSPTHETYLNSVSDFLHRAYQTFLREVGCTAKSEAYRLNQESRANVQGDIALNPAQFSHVASQFSDLLVFKLYKISSATGFDAAEIKFYNYEELRSLNGQLVSYAPTYLRGSRRFIREEQTDLIYEVVRQTGKFEGMYFLEGAVEFQLLFDSDDESFVINEKLAFSDTETLVLPFAVVNTKTLGRAQSADSLIGTLNGKWSGAVVKKLIVGHPFAFAFRKLYISPGSAIADRIESMFKAGEYYQLVDFIELLAFSETGAVDPKIAEYLDQDGHTMHPSASENAVGE